jgi:hypothetical protein
MPVQPHWIVWMLAAAAAGALVATAGALALRPRTTHISDAGLLVDLRRCTGRPRSIT